MKVKVNQDACVGCEACTAIAEDLFEINDAGLSECKVEEVPEEKKEAAHDAIEGCPTGAIVEE